MSRTGKKRNTRCEQMFTALSPTADILPRLHPRSPFKIQHCGRELSGYLPKLISVRMKAYQSANRLRFVWLLITAPTESIDTFGYRRAPWFVVMEWRHPASSAYSSSKQGCRQLGRYYYKGCTRRPFK
jgi:hypothetical protein